MGYARLCGCKGLSLIRGLTFFFCLRQASQPRDEGTPGMAKALDALD